MELVSGTEPSTWQLEYATSLGGPWTIAQSGALGPDDNNTTEGSAEILHLTPKTRYYIRAVAVGSLGKIEKTAEFTTTPTASPLFFAPHNSFNFQPTNDRPSEPSGSPTCEGEGYDFSSFGESFCWHSTPTPTSGPGGLTTEVYADGADTKYHFEYSTSKSVVESGGGIVVPGAGGSVTAAEELKLAEVKLEGLSPETTYYLRGVAENEVAPPTSTTLLTFTTHSARVEVGGFIEVDQAATSAHLIGSVNPNGFETHWRFEYSTSKSGPWSDGPEGTIAQAQAGYTEEGRHVEGELTGLSLGTPYFVRLHGENEPEAGHPAEATSEPVGFKTSGPPAVTTLALHAIHNEALRLLGYVEPNNVEASVQAGANYSTHYHFEYVTQRHFEEAGFTDAQSAPEVAFAGVEDQFIGEDVPGLQPGEAYRYRLTATNTTPGDPVVHGGEQALTVPAAPPADTEASCPNEALRSGLSAGLPDCRAYEQVTPVDKAGAEEPFHYNRYDTGNAGALIGEDGEHFEFDGQSVHWGSAGGSPYFFSRTEKGWQMTSGTPQPEAGIDIHYAPELYNPDLTQFAFSAGWQTEGGVESPSLEFKFGSPGGPYVSAASVSRKQIGLEGTGGWVAASEDFSKLIFATEDRTFVPGHSTGTASGLDLYEYSQGVFRQANVDSAGHTIGTCGASVPKGTAEIGGSEGTSSRHAVSADGSRVFFYAVPSGSSCSEPRHLYLRVGSAETIDLGTDTLMGANGEGTKALLEARNGNTQEVFLYEPQSHASTHLFSQGYEEDSKLLVSEDFSTIYISSSQRLTSEAPPLSNVEGVQYFYRYSISAKALSFVFEGRAFDQAGELSPHISPDGRYVYFTGIVPGIPAGALPRNEQAFRYDSAENLIQCISCASAFNPDPKQPALFTNEEQGENSSTRNAMPGETVASADGDYVFFDTISALVPQDVNGEVQPDERPSEHEYESSAFSPSSDVYEWRKSGVDGCSQLQGCVSLISSGGNGRLVMLLGSAADGRDVFFTTAAQLGSQDNDNALDVYDARIDGGFTPPPPRPTECEGDACSTPFAAPNDLTPSSSTFQGAGNVLGATPGAKPKPKPKPKKKTVKKKKKGKSKKNVKKAKSSHKSGHRRGR